MERTDGGNNRLRKLFSKLPRAEAPGDFEERLARRLGQEKTHRGVRPARLRAFAIPGLALLLVGTLSYYIYFTQSRTTGDEGTPQNDTMAAPRGTSGADRPEAKDVPSAIPAPADGESRAGEKERSLDEAISLPPDIRREPSPVERMKMGKTTPGRPMMIESSRPETVVRADSLAAKDTSAADSLEARPDSLLDSLKIRKPD